MVTILNGLIGGLVATIAMTAFMMTLGDDSPPPTAVLWSKYVGDGPPEEYQMQGMILHLLYGIIAGAVFVVLAVALGLGIASLGGAILWGLAYGVVLFVVGAGFWLNVVLGMDADAKMAGMFLFLHLVYGGVLGAWVAFDVL